ncbi:CopG family antitoxin [Oceanospirillum maris]|uniref:CopG family antitoxin n=1 Tax=Oceanospirillum maris TaxID=64977 RepID=UPI00041A1088|nr:CopG family antitoxin [Oceanospirillum maris]
MPSPKMEFSADHEKRKNTSLRLSNQMLKTLKIRAIEEDTSVQKLIENLIKAYLDGRITLTEGKKSS